MGLVAWIKTDDDDRSLSTPYSAVQFRMTLTNLAQFFKNDKLRHMNFRQIKLE